MASVGRSVVEVVHSHTVMHNSQKKKKKSGYMLDVPTILVARLPSEEISLSQRRLLWTELSLFSCVTPILQFVRIAEISRVKFRWRTLKSSRLKFLSCPWRSLTTPRSFHFGEEAGSCRYKLAPENLQKTMTSKKYVWHELGVAVAKSLGKLSLDLLTLVATGHHASSIWESGSARGFCPLKASFPLALSHRRSLLVGTVDYQREGLLK